MKQEKYGKVGLVHVDAHTDLYGPMYGSKIHHGNPFLLAVEEDLLDCSRVVQIGLRGSGFQNDWKVPKDLVRRQLPHHRFEIKMHFSIMLLFTSMVHLVFSDTMSSM